MVDQIVLVEYRTVISKIGYVSNLEVIENVNKALLAQCDLIKRDEKVLLLVNKQKGRVES